MTPRYVLAIDAGGTKCDAILVREDGIVAGWGRAAPPGIGGRHPAAMTEAFEGAMNALPEGAAAVHIGCSGPALPKDLTGTSRAIRFVSYPIKEWEAALCQANHEWGVVALSGTGAFVAAVTADGRQLRLDGVGPLLGDYGSAYEIGLAAMRAAMRSSWHPRHKTTLLEPVLETLGLEAAREMIPLNDVHVGRDRVARIAVAVDRAAAAGDAVASAIIEQAAASLAGTLRDVVEMLEIRSEPYPLVGAGGVIVGSARFWQAFCRLAAEIAPAFKPEVIRLPPVAGVALYALQRMEGIDLETARKNLLASVQEWVRRREAVS